MRKSDKIIIHQPELMMAIFWFWIQLYSNKPNLSIMIHIDWLSNIRKKYRNSCSRKNLVWKK
jgi:hypothetical protein